MNKHLLSIAFLLFLFIPQSFAQTIPPLAPPLNAAQEFAVLGGAAVHNINNTIVYARVGVAPGSTITGFPPGLALAGLNAGNQVAIDAQVSARAAYTALISQTATQNRTGQQLGNGIFADPDASNGMRLMPGIYKFDGDARLSGKLVLDGGGSSNAVFIFQIGKNFVIDPGSVISIDGGTQPKNVFFQVAADVLTGNGGNSGTPTALAGNILAQGNITLNRNLTLEGRALALSDNSIVNLNDSNIYLPTIVEADLSVSKTVSPGPYYIGDVLTYTITVRNINVDVATNVRVTEKLSSRLSFVSLEATRDGVPDNSITYNEASGILAIGSLGSRGTVIITLKAKIIAAGTISNNIRVLANEPDPNPGDNIDEVIIVVPAVSADLSVDKTIEPVKDEYNVGETVTYTITAKNNGPNNATGVVVTDKLPASLTFLSATATNGNSSYNPSTGNWIIGALNRGASQVLTMVAKINTAGTITNIATISGPQNDQVPGNNTARVDIPANVVPIADLSVVKTISPGPYSLNGEVTYTIKATNYGPNNATGVKVTEKLPGTLTFISATTSPASTTFNQATGIFDIGDLANGASATLTIVARINTTGNIINEVTIVGNEIDPNPGGGGGGTNPGGDPDPVNPPGNGDNKDTVMVCIKPIAPLAVSGPANVCIGQTSIVYSVPVVPGATSYTFTLPAGWSMAGGNSNVIVMPAPVANAIAVSVVVMAGSESGLISVLATNACGSSSATSLTVNVGAVPDKPGPVNISGGGLTPCSGSTLSFSIAEVPGATTYKWTVPNGWAIAAGQGTTNITVVAGASAGNISVTAANACGVSSSSLLAVAPLVSPDQPSPIVDNSTPCVGLTYSITAVPGTIYNWSVSAGFTIQSGQGTNKVVITANSPNLATGTISVTTSNGVCVSPASSLAIDAGKAGSQLFFPNAVSPNGDGLYDSWVVKNIINFPDNDVVIYNRWGNEVYRKTSYRNEWTAQGLEQGTYFYVFRVKECSGSDKVYKGYITVYR